MIVVVNTIKVKKGHGEEVAQRFQNSKGVELTPGFIRMEVLFTEDLEEHDELKVCTHWADKPSFESWVNSDSFRQAHAKREGSPGGQSQSQSQGQHPQSGGQEQQVQHSSQGQAHQASPQGESVMLGSKMTIHNVLVSRTPNEQ
ncbi:antibiotic biosynthesis monooxygenase [Paenibacillus sepulcri]